MARPWLTLTLLLSTSCLILQVSAIPKCSRTLFGEPNFEACRQLLQGNRYAPAYRGIDRIDRVSHLFTVWPQYLQGLQGWPRGVTERQYDNRVRLPQPDYATWLAGPDARGIGVPDGREFHHPRPWSKGEDRGPSQRLNGADLDMRARWMQYHTAPEDRP